MKTLIKVVKTLITGVTILSFTICAALTTAFFSLMIVSACFATSDHPYRIHDGGDHDTVLIWLHGYRMNSNQCPHTDADYVVIAPNFRREADWKNYDMRGLAKQVRAEYNPKQLYIEGYSRGAYGAAWHAAENPGMFDKVICLAGGYPTFPDVKDSIMIVGGAYDNRWFEDSRKYAAYLGVELKTVNSSHNPTEFYSALKVNP